MNQSSTDDRLLSAGQTVGWENSLVYLVSLVYSVCLVCLVEPDKPDRPSPVSRFARHGRHMRSLGIQHESRDHAPRMAQYPPRPLPQFSLDRRERLGRPRGRTGQACNANEAVVGQHPDLPVCGTQTGPNEHRMGPRISPGHLRQPRSIWLRASEGFRTVKRGGGVTCETA